MRQKGVSPLFSVFSEILNSNLYNIHTKIQVSLMITNKITEKIITKLKSIPLDKQQQILDYIDSILQESLLTSENSKPSPIKRVLGLHQGKIWVSDDFNDPLPE